MTEFCFWEFWNSPSADRVHPVDSGDSEGLVFGAGQAVAERSQSQPLVVPTAGPLDHITHGLPVWRADGRRRAWANSGPALQTLLSQRRCIILHNPISAIANISLSVFCAFLTRDLILVYLWLKTAAVFPGWWRILLPGYMLTPNGPLCVFNKVFRQRSRRNSGSNISITWKIWISY